MPELPERGPVPLATTPVIAGFHPDPTVCRVGDRFYLANSSFEYFPAVPVFTSTDLVDWEQVGNALERPTQFLPGSRAASTGIFAPTLRHHDGRFWLITTDVGASPPGQLLVTADGASGPWSDPVLVPVQGIDPDLAWDERGRCFVTWCHPSTDGVRIEQVRIDAASGALLERPRPIWSGTGLAHPEGPHLHRRGAWWYLLIAEGGTERGHTVAVARSRRIEGPYEGSPGNPLLTHRSTTHQVQNVGHADLVDRGDDRWAMVHLGVRARGISPSFHVNGRETFFAEVDWVDDWPVVRPRSASGVPASTAFDERFAAPTLHPRWISPGAGIAEFAERASEGGLRLRPAVAPNGAPSALSVRTADLCWTAEIELELELGAGRCDVVLRLDERHSGVVRIEDGTACAELTIGPLAGRFGVSADGLPSRVTVMVRSIPSRSQGPDDVEFDVRAGTEIRPLARFDGRYLSTEVAGGFTGRVLGVGARRGTVRVLRFTYSPDDGESG